MGTKAALTAWIRLVVVAVLMASAAVLPVSASAAPMIEVSDSSISTPVGIAADSELSLYWVTNRSEAKVYGVDPASGQTKRTVTYQASVTAVEALAYIDSMLFIGDIGDPAANRDHISVYRPKSLNDGSATVTEWKFKYPDSAHDAAAMMITPRHNLYFVTKGDNASIYRSARPVEQLSEGKVNTLVKVASAPSWVTDATFVGADSMVMRTYNSVFVVDAFSFQKKASAKLPAYDSGEAVTGQLGKTGSLIVVDNKAHAQLTAVDLPKSLSDVGAPPSTPPSSDPNASPSAAESQTADTESGDGQGANDETETDANVDVETISPGKTWGTRLAIAAAVLVSLIAGTFVFITHPRGRPARRAM